MSKYSAREDREKAPDTTTGPAANDTIVGVIQQGRRYREYYLRVRRGGGGVVEVGPFSMRELVNWARVKFLCRGVPDWVQRDRCDDWDMYDRENRAVWSTELDYLLARRKTIRGEEDER